MSKYERGTWLCLATDHAEYGTLLLLALAMAAPAHTEGPSADFKFKPDEDEFVFTFTSPDQTVRVEQYFKDLEDDGLRFDPKHT